MNKNPSNADEIFRWPSRCSCERCNYARKAWESIDTGKINTNNVSVSLTDTPFLKIRC